MINGVWIGGIYRRVKLHPQLFTYGLLEYDDWNVVRTPTGFEIDESPRVGDIVICPDHNPTLVDKHETLFHEMIHAAEVTTGLYLTEEQVEKIGKCLFQGLLSSGLYRLEPEYNPQFELPLWMGEECES